MYIKKHKNEIIVVSNNGVEIDITKLDECNINYYDGFATILTSSIAKGMFEICALINNVSQINETLVKIREMYCKQATVEYDRKNDVIYFKTLYIREHYNEIMDESIIEQLQHKPCILSL